MTSAQSSVAQSYAVKRFALSWIPFVTLCAVFCLSSISLQRVAAQPADTAGSPVQDPALAALVDKLPAPDAASAHQIFADIIKMGPPALVKLVAALQEPDAAQGPKVSDTQTAAKSGDAKVEYALYGLASYVQRAGAIAEQEMYGETLAGELDKNYSDSVKAFLIQQLTLAGGPESVPALSKILLASAQDPQRKYIYHDAAEALLNIRRRGGGPVLPEVVAAFRSALPKAQGIIRAEIIEALGTLRDRQSMPQILEAVNDRDSDVRLTAIYALGRIGDQTAVDALLKAATVQEPLERARATDAALLLARRLQTDSALYSSLTTSRSMTQAAERIYRQLQRTRPQDRYVQAAVLGGLSSLLGAGADRDLLAAMNSEALDLRTAAIQAAASVREPAATTRWVGYLNNATPNGKAAMLTVLARRGDVAAVAPVVAAFKDTNETVRTAAITAAGAFDSADATRALTGVLSSPRETDRQAAQVALQRMPGKAATPVIANALTTATPEARRTLLNILGARGATAQVNSVLAYTSDKDAGVRAAAWSTLGMVADVQALPSMLKAALNSPEEQFNDAVRALMAASRGGDVDQRAQPMIAALNGADAKTRAALFTLLGRVGGNAALNSVRAALSDPDAGVQDAAIRSLINWPDASPAADLLALAKSGRQLNYRVLALNSYVRKVGTQNLDPDEKLRMYKDALAAAPRPEDRKAVLAALGDAKTGINTPAALQTVVPLLNDAGVQAEAAQAAVNIAGRTLEDTDDQGAAQVKEAMQTVLRVSKDDRIRKQAADALAGQGGSSSARRWLVLGPYSGNNNGFNRVYEPETMIDTTKTYNLFGNRTARWKPALADDKGYVDLLSVFNPNENVIGYATTWVKSPTARKAVLSAGSDDGAKIWLNGKVVVNNGAPRSAAPGSDQVAVDLKEGWNQILFKISQGGGDWGFYLELLDEQKKPLTDLNYSTRGGK